MDLVIGILPIVASVAVGAAVIIVFRRRALEEPLLQDSFVFGGKETPAHSEAGPSRHAGQKPGDGGGDLRIELARVMLADYRRFGWLLFISGLVGITCFGVAILIGIWRSNGEMSFLSLVNVLAGLGDSALLGFMWRAWTVAYERLLKCIGARAIASKSSAVLQGGLVFQGG